MEKNNFSFKEETEKLMKDDGSIERRNPFSTPEAWVTKAYNDAIRDVLCFDVLPKEKKTVLEKELDEAQGGNIDVEKLKKWVYATQNKGVINKIEQKSISLLKNREDKDKKRKEEEKKEEDEYWKNKDKSIKKKEIEQEGNIQNIVVFLIADKKRSKATETMTKNFLDNNSVYTTRDDEKSECWIYKGGIYIPQARTYIKEYCRNILGKLYTTNICNEVINKIEADTFIEQEDFFKEEDPSLIAVNNGILNLKTKELKLFDPSYRFFSKLNINYVDGSDCPMIKRFFKSLFKDELEIKVIQEIFGFVLYRQYFLEKAFMFLGDGRNGKGKTLELIKLFIGIDNCAEISLEAMEKDHFAIGELFKKYANLCGDLSKTALKHTGEFKKLTGRDLLSASRKFKTRVKFINYSKMMFSCNELPMTYDITEAFFNRWIILDFPYTFLTQKELENIKEKDNYKLRDPNIIEKITTEKEMEGLLCWALEGLKRILEQKTFSYSPSTSDTKNKWLRKSDSCMAFIMDCVEEDFEGHVIKNDFRIMYAQYCRKHKIRPSGDQVVKDLLISTFGAGEDRKYVDDTQERVWVGIKFKENIIKDKNVTTQNTEQTKIKTQDVVVEEIVK